jgi:transposase
MRTGRPRTRVVWTAEERHRIESLGHRSRSVPDLARRARIILACAEDRVTTNIAKRLHVSPTTICTWRARFLDDRLDGLYASRGWPRRGRSG